MVPNQVLVRNLIASSPGRWCRPFVRESTIKALLRARPASTTLPSSSNLVTWTTRFKPTTTYQSSETQLRNLKTLASTEQTAKCTGTRRKSLNLANRRATYSARKRCCRDHSLYPSKRCWTKSRCANFCISKTWRKGRGATSRSSKLLPTSRRSQELEILWISMHTSKPDLIVLVSRHLGWVSLKGLHQMRLDTGQDFLRQGRNQKRELKLATYGRPKGTQTARGKRGSRKQRLPSWRQNWSQAPWLHMRLVLAQSKMKLKVWPPSNQATALQKSFKVGTTLLAASETTILPHLTPATTIQSSKASGLKTAPWKLLSSLLVQPLQSRFRRLCITTYWRPSRQVLLCAKIL